MDAIKRFTGTALMTMAILLPMDSHALGNSGTQKLHKDPADRTSRTCSVREGNDCHFAFNSDGEGTSVNSAVFQVSARTAVACLAPMDAGNTVGKAKFWKVVGTSNTGTQQNSMAPTGATSNTLDLNNNPNCFTMTTGRWWIEVVLSTNSSVDAVVVITGQEE